MLDFAKFINPEFEVTRFHKAYYRVLDDFAKGKIKKLIVSVPPQHGKSLGASNLLPAYLLGCDPRLRVCIASYSFSLARRFGQSVQRLIDSKTYASVFEQTKLKGMSGASKGESTSRTADEFDIVGHYGGLKLVGREGSLTGNRVDVMILDDMYKDAAEANSPLIRENVWQWYTSVVKTRLHNDSRELIVFTRWHEDDLIGRLLDVEPQEWTVVNFPAIKIGEPTVEDPRNDGEALWAERHSVELLLQKRAIDPIAFETLYQCNPTPSEGLLYSQFSTYEAIEEHLIRRAAYVDSADTGRDYLCAIAYGVAQSGVVYLLDVVYTQAPMEVTEGLCAQMLLDNDVELCYVESNNGGRGFARSLGRMAGRCRVESFHQSANKVSRIVSNATEVMRSVRMPKDWRECWREFSRDLLAVRREVAGSATDDAADALTGIVEKEFAARSKKISKVAFRGS